MRKTILVTAIGSFSSAAVIDRCKKENYRVLGCDIYPAQWIVASGRWSSFFRRLWPQTERLSVIFWKRSAKRNMWIL